MPGQPDYLDYVMDHVARHSLKPVEGGWQWKFDRRVFEQFGGQIRSSALPYLPRVRCRFALLRSENGLVTEDISASMYEQLGRVAPVIEIPEAGHHAMLDQPLLLLTAVRTLLADWDHSQPMWRVDAGPVGLAQLALEELARRVAGQRLGEVDGLRQLVAGEVLAGRT